jgi:thioredoxin
MEITSEELKTKIDNGETILVDFWAPWCGPCQVLKPTFEKISKSYDFDKSKVEMFTFDVEKNKEMAINLGIRAVPTIKGFSNGSEIYSQTGIQTETQLKDVVKNLLNG